MSLGLLGRKMGMTQVNDSEQRIAVTIVETGPCVVLQKKTIEKDGYTAFKIAFKEQKEKALTKADIGQFKKAGVDAKRYICEFRVEASDLDKFDVGQEIKTSDLFKEGQKIDVAGTSKGRGFSGVVKKFGFAGQTQTHGTHEYFRHGGSIGMCTWPGYVQKNTKMPGQYGDSRITVQNLKVVRILEDKNCVLISGAVPGAKNGLLEITPSKRYPAAS